MRIQQRGQHAYRRVHRGGIVENRRGSRVLRRAGRVGVQRQVPGQGPELHVVTRRICQGPGRAKARHGDVDDAWLQRADLRVAHPQAGRDAGPEPLDEHIGVTDESGEHCAIGLGLEVQRDAVLAAVAGQEHLGLGESLPVAVRRLFDLHHGRAQRCHDLGRERPCGVLGEVKHAEPVKC